LASGYFHPWYLLGRKYRPERLEMALEVCDSLNLLVGLNGSRTSGPHVIHGLPRTLSVVVHQIARYEKACATYTHTTTARYEACATYTHTTTARYEACATYTHTTTARYEKACATYTHKTIIHVTANIIMAIQYSYMISS
jgi:hypothetical protein